jgi:starvation-inducible DNA-binding protein
MAKHLGLDEKDRDAIISGLSALLADTYSVYLKTHNFHWNVTGPMFVTLHTLFETQYTELALAVDEIAERIRALDAFAPGSFKAFQELTCIPETMVALLVEDNEAIVRTARALIPIAESAHDTPTADLATSRIQIHEKTAWMLRSLING